jgi:hypothetical protein
MHAYRLKTLGCALALAVSVASSATAQSQPGPTGADAAQQADDHFLKGKAFMKAGNTRGAYEEYKAAWGLRKTYDTAANLGNVELQLGMPRDAAEHMAYALRSYAVTGTTPDKLERMKQVFAQARAQVGGITVKVSVDGAEVFVDDRSVGRSPIADELFVDPGSHVVTAQLQGFDPARTSVAVDKGGSQAATLTLTRTAAPPPTSTGQPPPLPARPNKIVLVTGGVTAGAAVVIGAVLLGVAAAKGSTVSSLQAQVQQEGGCASATAGANCTDLSSALTSKRTLGNTGLWTLVAGGGVGAATLVYGLVGGAKAPPPKSGLRVLPVPAPGGGGLVVQGTF